MKSGVSGFSCRILDTRRVLLAMWIARYISACEKLMVSGSHEILPVPPFTEHLLML